MIDTNQLLIIITTTVMTVLLTIIGIQLIFLLHDARRFISHLNSILDEFEKIGIHLRSGYSEVTTFFSGIQKMLQVIDFVSKKKRTKAK